MDEVQVNLSDYLTRKQAGTAKIIKLNGQPYYTERRYDPMTGKPVPLQVPLQRETLAKMVESTRNDLANAEAALADLDAATELINA